MHIWDEPLDRSVMMGRRSDQHAECTLRGSAAPHASNGACRHLRRLVLEGSAAWALRGARKPSSCPFPGRCPPGRTTWP
eukprot:5491313-Prymnesium_polylepis.1